MDSKQSLTATAVERMQARTGLTDAKGNPFYKIIWDTKLRGFGVMLSPLEDTKTYIVRITIKGKTNKKGKPKRPRIALGRVGALTFEEAKQKARWYLTRAGDGIDPREQEKQTAASQRTLLTVVEERIAWVKSHKKLRERSLEDYEDMMRFYFKGWHDWPLRNITREDVEKRHKELPGEIKQRRAYAKVEITANRAMRALRATIIFAKISDKALPENPVRVLADKGLWYGEQKRDSCVPNHLFTKFWEATGQLANTTHRDLLRYIVLTGKRREEARSLRWDQIDFDAKTITASSQKTKSKRKHVLPLSDFLLAMLKERRLATNSEDWVWSAVSATGHVMELKFPLGLVSEKIGLHLTPHDLRRTFSTVADRLMSRVFVTRLMDHSDRTITDRYNASDIEDLRERMQQITDEILRLAGIREPLPTSLEELWNLHSKRFGQRMFNMAGLAPEIVKLLLKEGLERGKPITDNELAQRMQTGVAA
ncbi:MAG: tyrosine-type recombinase/integrase [Rhodospirillaceae bacterium]|nr:tyrosine-type recombinase/integrase [Rhodospirillaceae bacterium]